MPEAGKRRHARASLWSQIIGDFRFFRECCDGRILIARSRSQVFLSFAGGTVSAVMGDLGRRMLSVWQFSRASGNGRRI
jgi:hypothetical protein